jgi:heme-NO-binding protein
VHGLFLTELERYVGATSGPEAWGAVCVEAGLAGVRHQPTEAYANAEFVVLVEATSRLTGTGVADLLENFGAFLVPALLATYLPAPPPAWSALDLLEQSEQHCHAAARQQDTLANPPRLRARRVSATEVQITYASPRRLCHIARGIARGVLTHYRASGSVSESTCMHRGDAVCLISVRSSSN